MYLYFYIFLNVITPIFCFRFFAKRPVGVPVYKSSGRVSKIARFDTVRILHDDDYRILRINPHSRTVVLQRLDAGSSRRSFTRPTTDIHLPPPSTHEATTQIVPAIVDAEAQVDEPTENCLCEPVPPRVHPDTEDFAIQCQIDGDKYVHVVHAEITSVRQLCQRLEYVEAQLASRQQEVLRWSSSTLIWKTN